MSEAGSETGWIWQLAVGLGLLTAVGLGAWVLLHGGGPGDEPAQGDATAPAELETAGARPPAGRSAANTSAAVPGPQEDATSAIERGSPSPGPATDASGDVRGPDAGDTADAGQARVARDDEWADPANREMLGRKTWMAEPTDEEAEAIEDVIDKPRPQRYPIDLQQRRRGVDMAKQLVEGCFDELRARRPQADGRISVGFELVADGRQAHVSDLEILAKVGLDDPGFEDCIFQRLSRASFSTAEQGTMRVEIPFLFDIQ